jgi:AcrR family transcriptional regulator
MDIGKINKKKEMGMETKRKIYEAANYLFSKQGIEKVSVDSIVERAEVAKGSFYVHFKSKDALIASFLSDYVKNMDFNYRAYLDSIPKDRIASEVLLGLVDKIVDIIANQIGYDLMRLLYEVNISKTIDTAALLDYNRDLYKVLSLVIDQGIQQGEFKTNISKETLARHYVMALRGLTYEWCIRYPNFDFRSESRQHFEILIEGLR